MGRGTTKDDKLSKYVALSKVSIIFLTYDNNDCCKLLCSFSDFLSFVLGVCWVFSSCCASMPTFKESVSVPAI